MANLLNQFVDGPDTYKGLLNLNTLNSGLTGSLQAVTDGMGVASPLHLSTTLVGVNGNLVVGHTSALARHHVRGDGTNPIARFEDNTGLGAITINNNSILIGGSTSLGSLIFPYTTNNFTAPNNNGTNISIYNRIASSSVNYFDFSLAGESVNHTSGIRRFLALNRSINNTVGSGSIQNISIEYTINNSGAQTGTATGIFLNATETNLNGMTHNLMDLQMGGVSRLNVSNGGWIRSGSFMSISSQQVTFASYANGQLTLFNNAFDGFGRINFGGTTNVFPALKRVGTGLEVRLADDSNYAGITADVLAATGPNAYLVTQQIFSGGGGTTRFGNGVLMGFVNAGTVHASAAVEIRTTTRGFLLPRMTTTERDAIASPAAGLIIYNTTTNKLNVFTTVWEQVTSA